jgi:hypothetical protein
VGGDVSIALKPEGTLKFTPANGADVGNAKAVSWSSTSSRLEAFLIARSLAASGYDQHRRTVERTSGDRA